MPAISATAAWQSRLTATQELWQVWDGTLQIDTEAVEANRVGIRLSGGSAETCACRIPTGTTVYWRAMSGTVVAGYIPQ